MTERSQKYIVGIFGIATVAIVIWTQRDAIRELAEEPAPPPLFEWGDSGFSEQTLANSHYRMAIMESFGNLDTLVANECVPPLKLKHDMFQSEENFRIASQFLSDLHAYESPVQLTEFMTAVTNVLKTAKESQPQELIQHFSTFRGSDSILKSRSNSELLNATHHIASHRMQQLLMNAQTGYGQNLIDQGLIEQMRTANFDVVPSENAPTQVRTILRYWELTSTRYLLCQSGNTQASQIVKTLHPQEYRPIYVNAPNVVLDPIRRQFQVLLTMGAEKTGSDLTLRASPNGPMALVEFKGALPRAKLYADWLVVSDDKKAQEILYSQSFIPQIKVILRKEALPQPQRPAETDRLPPVKIHDLADQHATLKIPPLEHNVVLLFTNPYKAGWRVVVAGKSAVVLHANLNSCAVYLDPSKKKRTIVFEKS